VLRELCQEIEWREDLKIPIRARSEVVGMRVGKGLTSLLLGLVDNLSSIGYLDQPRQTERATNHVLYQAFDPCLLIYALSDPDYRVVKGAQNGLRYISRRVDGFGLKITDKRPTKPQYAAAQDKWKSWYRSVRPNGALIE